MAELISAAAERHALDHTSPLTGQLAEAAAWTQDNTRYPSMMSGLAETRLLEALIVVGDAQHVLEIGTFTAIGTIAMAAALGPGGRVTTLEVDTENAEIARRHIEQSGYSDRIELLLGDALQTLARLPGPFDLVYIDAAKEQYPDYFDAVADKLSGRGVIIADNLFRGGAVLEESPASAGNRGMLEFSRRVQDDERFDNVLLTVGDGLMLAWRRPPASPTGP
jgi:caffeoyl-CoA O-methyltransferase